MTAAEEHVQDDLRRQEDADHVRPDEALVKRIQPAREPGNRPRQRKHERLRELHVVTEEGHPGFVDPDAGQGQAELRADQEAAAEIDDDDGGQRQVVVSGAFRELVHARRHQRDRGNAVLTAEIVPAPRQPVARIRACQCPQRDENDAGRPSAQEQKAGHQEGQEQADQHRDREHHEQGPDPQVPSEQGNAVPRRSEEQRLAKAHDASEAPQQIEAQAEEREDQDAGDEDDPEILKDQGQGDKHDKQAHLESRDSPEPANLLPHRRPLLSRTPIVQHSFGSTSPLLCHAIS
jgi:hypothetical protein